MIRIHFLLDDLDIEAPSGTRLQEIAEAGGADLTFGCSSGSCGTCRVRIAQGLDQCSPMGPEERDFLGALAAPPDQRLACQVRVTGNIEVEYLGL